MKRPLITALSFTPFFSLHAAVIVSDDFEGGPFSSDWDNTSTATIVSGTGANGTSNFANIPAGSGALGATFDGGASDFFVDFYVNSQNTTNRQFNFQVSSFSTAPNTSGATINLRYQGGWDAFNGSAWTPVSGLTALTPDEWHHVRVTGNGWGSAGANYDIEVSAAGATAFNSSATGQTIYHAGNPDAQMAQSFNFNSTFGSNPGFQVDQAQAEVQSIPEPSSSALLGLLGAIALLRHRR